MNDSHSDSELLRAFVRHCDQTAFARVVRRHVDLVYATAFRKLEESGAAQEVAQNVFAALARKSWQFGPDDSLPAWLYKTTLLESGRWLRGELRRRRREQTAAELGTTMKTPDDQPALRALVPLLDEALLSLREKDRAALLLRFYENQSLRDLGKTLGLGEDAAQKRVAGALGKLAAFFQRRGYRTATVAAVAAVLHHTASAAPAAVTSALALAAGNLAPPTLLGLTALASRFAGWTNIQTAGACVVLLMVPLAWEWNEHRQARIQHRLVQTQLLEAQTEMASLTTRLDQLTSRAAQLDASLVSAGESAQGESGKAKEFEAWKTRLQALLTADAYQWPSDSPFVRIPKNVVPQLGVTRPVAPPGVLKPESRELLGLTPQERESVEAALHSHFAALDDLIGSHVYETNQAANIFIPKSALASQVWTVPALGDDMKSRVQELQTRLREALGPERWQLVQSELESVGTDTSRRILNLDAGDYAQEIAVWIERRDKGFSVGSGWSSRGSSFSTDGQSLEMFAPGAAPKPGKDASDYLGARSLPDALATRMKAWFQQQAASRIGGPSK